MARKLFNGAALRIAFRKEVDAAGKDVLVVKSFNGINENASAEQLQQFAAAFASLSTYPVRGVATVTQHIIQR